MQILLAIDASPASQVAVQDVAARPWPSGSRVEVLTAVETSQPWALGEVAQEVTTRARQLVDTAAMYLKSHRLAAAGAVAEGDPKTVILDHAAAMSADLIVVGAHGMSALE